MIRNLWSSLISPTSLRLRFGSGLVFSVVAAGFNSGSTLLVNIFVANLLGRETFGEFAIIQNTLLTLATVATLATGITATKYVAEFRSIDKPKTSRVLGVCSALSIGMGSMFALSLLIGAPFLATVVLKAGHLTLGIRLAALVVFFTVHNFYQTGALAGLEHYSGIARAGVIGGIAYLVVCVAGALIWGREGALAGLSIAAGIQWLSLRYSLRRETARQELFVDYRGWRDERELIVKFALPAALSGCSSMPALWLANAVLVRQAGGYSQMALYAAATNLRIVVLLLPNLLNNVGMSVLNNVRGLGNLKQFRKAFWSNLALTAGVTAISAIVMTAVGPYALVIFGRRFEGGYPVLVALMVSTIFEILMQATYQIVLTHGKMWLSFFAVVFPRDLLVVVLAFVFAPKSGALGLALAYTCGAAFGATATALAALFLSRPRANYAGSLVSPA
ncbi:MAG TPA: hypothetical protein VE961_10380 [Pyrinomonadaceae bacterium]|nr:hypothetical protein [Pyrinomonadaceae bacterium]